jgi:CheY-like chemotaxis protein
MNNRYIIFADDDDDDLDLVTGFFKQYEEHISILVFNDGKDVIKFLEETSSKQHQLPLLVVLDINMPRLDGMSTLVAIRDNEQFKNVAVVIYTTSMSRSNIQLCKDLDATWLIKPNSIQQIKETARILADFCNLNTAG